MISRLLSHCIRCVCVLFILDFAASHAPAQSHYVYTYTGPEFDDYDTIGATFDRITFSMTLTEPMPPDLAGLGSGQYLAVDSWTMSDGVQTLTSADSILNAFDFWTDANGDIIDWRVQVTSPLINGVTTTMFTHTSGPYGWGYWDRSAHGEGGWAQIFAVGSWTADPDFTLSASPSSQTVKAGKNAAYSLSVEPINGFSGTVGLICQAIPAAASCTILPNTNGTATANIDTSPGKKGTPKGSYIIVFRGTDGSLTHDASVNLVVK